MARSFVTFTALLAVAASQQHNVDFMHEKNGFRFVYHADHDLFLTIYNNTCYYSWVPDGSNGEDILLHDNGEWVQNRIMQDILNHGHVFIKDPIHLINEHDDVLASFYCRGRHINYVDIQFSCYQHEDNPACVLATPEPVRNNSKPTPEPTVDFMHEKDGFKYIYHADHDLLLTIYNNTCYYSWVPDGSNGEDILLHDNGEWVQNRIKQDVQTHGHLFSKDPSYLIDEHDDVLASFYCRGLNIYYVDIQFSCYQHENDPACVIQSP